MAPTDLSPFSAISRAEPAVSTPLMVFSLCLEMNLRHWPSATDSDCTALISASVAPGTPEQVHLDAQEMFAGDEQAAPRQQVVDIGDAAVERVLDRHDTELGIAVLHRRDGVLEGGAGQRHVIGKQRMGRRMTEGAGLTLERDLSGHWLWLPTGLTCAAGSRGKVSELSRGPLGARLNATRLAASQC
jgi:hypothetical protein